jgi:hypothetical protein
MSFLRSAYLAVDELPPKPDPQTGEPKPPQAPGFIGTKNPNARDRITDPAHTPSPPAGQGPVLAWYKSSQRGAILLCVGIFIFIAIGVTVDQASASGG